MRRRSQNVLIKLSICICIDLYMQFSRVKEDRNNNKDPNQNDKINNNLRAIRARRMHLYCKTALIFAEVQEKPLKFNRFQTIL